MGQNIGTCITAILSSFGTNKNAKRAAMVHLSFNIIGTVVLLGAFAVIKAIFPIPLLAEAATQPGIAIIHSVFNVACTLLLLPASSLLEKLAYKLVPDTKQPDTVTILDERLLPTPSIAIERCYDLTADMAKDACDALKNSISCLNKYDSALAESIRASENKTDGYEDMIGTYLVKLSTHKLNDHEGARASMLLKAIGDFERISDHAVNILESAEELRDKGIIFSADAKVELSTMCNAVLEIVELSCRAFTEENSEIAAYVEPLEQVIDGLKDHLRTQHIQRLRQGGCGIEAGFVWNDLITNMERVSDHCSNIAGCTIDVKESNMNIHQSLKNARTDDPEYKEKYNGYKEKYLEILSLS
jgi:phosphate:Na+ symporter